ncbi:hypothetical protein J1N35_028729 [Gossypium stocksii]|uniref:Uncharacterized protein n=1 Tax=Gossypium stocksii TaxID=47602 RepID=A0A9D3ZSQ8_9ROSI|nr:hypothetical protein J1N35_028729 [Gossypium stocksii]
MAEAFSFDMDMLQVLLNTIVGKLTENNNALEAIVTTLNKKIKKLEEELAVCRVVVGKGVLSIKDGDAKVSVVSIYFTGDVAILWWNCRPIDEKRGGIKIRT